MIKCDQQKSTNTYILRRREYSTAPIFLSLSQTRGGGQSPEAPTCLVFHLALRAAVTVQWLLAMNSSLARTFAERARSHARSARASAVRLSLLPKSPARCGWPQHHISTSPLCITRRRNFRGPRHCLVPKIFQDFLSY